MGQATCAFCKTEGELTREHLWPTSLHSRLLKLGEQKQSAFWLARLQKEIAGEPTIRDVCARCNNGVLSNLDGYICTLFDQQFVRIPAYNEVVLFEFDYHLLKRWLLKMSYNSARIHTAADTFAMEAMLPYILGKDDRLGKYTQLFLQMTYSDRVPEEERVPDAELPADALYEPLHHRCGQLAFRVPGVGQKVLRVVHLRAFSFYLAFFKPGEKTAVMKDFEQVFTQTIASMTRLYQDQGLVQVHCNGIGAWQSIRGSRADRIVFGDHQ